jgi:outer membrane protein OmpA-like peptidoglycan-associated protein
VNKIKFNVIALAVGLALSAQSIAAELTAADYAAAEKKIAVDFTTAKSACASLSGNASEICLVEAKGKESVAKADLEAKNQPTPDTRLQAQIARAEADFAVAKERCDDVTATAKTECLQAAQTAEATAKAKANKEMESAMTNVQVEPKKNATLSDNNMRASDTLFDFDSADLLAAGRASLDDFVGKSKENSSAEITVVGYTDRLGSEAYNQQLSEARTEVVKDYLVSEGIDASRISAEGRGQAQPTTTADECNGDRSAEVIACLQPDRRVVVSMTSVASSM